MSRDHHVEAKSVGYQVLVALMPLGIAVALFLVVLMLFAAQEPASDAARSVAYALLGIVVMGVVAFFRAVASVVRILRSRGRPTEPHILAEDLSDNPMPPPAVPNAQ